MNLKKKSKIFQKRIIRNTLLVQLKECISKPAIAFSNYKITKNTQELINVLLIFACSCFINT